MLPPVDSLAVVMKDAQMAAIPLNLDPRLWVRSSAFGSDGYLLGNAHTFPGRFSVWWVGLERSSAASLSDLDECSSEAAAWLRGFLAGSEPGHWFEDDGFAYDEDDPRTSEWREAVANFHQTGTWRKGPADGVDMWPTVVG